MVYPVYTVVSHMKPTRAIAIPADGLTPGRLEFPIVSLRVFHGYTKRAEESIAFWMRLGSTTACDIATFQWNVPTSKEKDTMWRALSYVLGGDARGDAGGASAVARGAAEPDAADLYDAPPVEFDSADFQQLRITLRAVPSGIPGEVTLNTEVAGKGDCVPCAALSVRIGTWVCVTLSVSVEAAAGTALQSSIILSIDGEIAAKHVLRGVLAPPCLSTLFTPRSHHNYITPPVLKSDLYGASKVSSDSEVTPASLSRSLAALPLPRPATRLWQLRTAAEVCLRCCGAAIGVFSRLYPRVDHAVGC